MACPCSFEGVNNVSGRISMVDGAMGRGGGGDQ